MARQKKEKLQDGELSILDKLEKKYGLGKADVKKLTIVSTGSIQFNIAMKIGGTALGKMYEIFGPESSGKSTITLHQIAEYQKAFPEKKVALIDFEYTFSPEYAEAIGIDVENLLIYQPTTMEEGYDMIIDLIKNDLVSLVVIDSQTAAAPKAILEGEMSDSTISLQARLNSKFCLKVRGLLSLHGCSLIFVSQLRDNIGSMSGETAITTGGKAIRFYSDVRWKIWKLNDKDHELNKTTIDVVKNKIANPYGKAVVNILWGIGFDKMGEILSYAEDFGIIKRGGAWYSYGETKIGQGLEKVKNLMEDNPELYSEIEAKVLEKLFPKKEELSIEELLLEESAENENL